MISYIIGSLAYISIARVVWNETKPDNPKVKETTEAALMSVFWLFVLIGIVAILPFKK